MEDLRHIREIEQVSQGAPASRDPVVVASWLRCLNQHGLDPARRAEAYIVPDAALRAHRQRSEDLIAIARSGIENLYRLVAGQNYVLLLADHSGVTVEYMGDAAQKAELRRSGLFLGAEWRESRAGTNALGACLETGESLVIHQSDHFDVTHGGLSCTAAPIYDTRGKLTAVLDISLLSSPRPRVSQMLALNLVRQTVRRIELANIMAESRREWVLRLSGSPDFLDVDPEAAVSLDGAGCVIGMTHGAARLLARAAGQDWRAAGDLIGRPISDFLRVTPDRLEDLTRQRPAAERLIQTRDGHHLFGHAIEPRRLPPARTRGDPPALPPALRDLAGPEDAAMADLLAHAARLAPGRLPLLIEGETGTGKLTLARAIHAAGRVGPCVSVPCAELAEGDEALLFGRVAGRRHEPGLIDGARGGTLILDKVGELPARMQGLLLRLLGEGAWLPIGATRPERADLRLIATHQGDLLEAASAGRFRRDLAHRLAGAVLRLPPLRARRDLLWLAERLLKAAGGAGRLSPAAWVSLASHDWPGNLHELHHLMAQLSAGLPRVVGPADLPAPFAENAPAAARGDAALLRRILAETGGNVSEAARRLGVDRTTVHRRIRRYGL
ncbi:sigma-54-dependent Fis family transcriptional regulator [Sinirhodobacter populi]|uniref:Sigma-54-dependent Fis family transcriptional regulator n=1 Tax=Paenirhodobacter populi TaxID=2306993 RepID=A0A443KET8_9RHOB|nr:sigma-54-dependent Fis family transcriptional regulator [Sinirhodobacter populi]RWR31196.1 sigma-54-dependent Fis family transcriptional regulator [Sinirhodobacter populi]